MTRFAARTRRGLRADIEAMQALLDKRDAEIHDLHVRLRNTARMVQDRGDERAELQRKLAALSRSDAVAERGYHQMEAERDQARAEAAELARQVADRTQERDQAERARAQYESAHQNQLRSATQMQGQLADARAEVKSLRAQLEAEGKDIERLRGQFPACPACGCRAPDDPDNRECGCDEGCNDGDQAPGVNVITHQRDVAEQRLTDVQAEVAKREASQDRIRQRLEAQLRQARAEAPARVAELEAEVAGFARSLDLAHEAVEKLEAEVAALREQLAVRIKDAMPSWPVNAVRAALGLPELQIDEAAPAQAATDSAQTAPTGRKARGAGPRTGRSAAGRTGPSGGTEETGIAE